ncbi:polar amino acid transport system substrate-binding protein [Prauserella sediminis]|uniref:Polar amino acid transport system substrate-binding protein n=1 Tax=Prauserella sediminis TaxID=577680 RepID=A0A839XQH2_9PSEU|nr:ABC transporter substrate-binding protein [Prauserella sediminis]MBB3665470.1 polar amino acid transport system substrate-binding protein [Prauserella sediminis]
MKIHKPLTTALVGALFALSITACSDSSSADGSTTPEQESDITKGVEEDPAAVKLLPAKTKNDGEITVAMDLSYPPTSFLSEEDKSPIGYNVDIARLLGAKLGLEVEIKDVSFDTIIPGIQGGRYDFTTTNMTPTPERRKVLELVTYWNSGSSLVTPVDNPEGLTFDEPESLCGHTVAVMKGTTQAEQYLPSLQDDCKKAGEAPIDAVVLPNVQEALTQLSSGRMEAVFYDTPSLAWAAKQQPDQFEMQDQQYQKETGTDVVTFGLAKNSPLTKAMHAAMQSLIDSDKYKEALGRWGLESGAIPKSEILN